MVTKNDKREAIRGTTAGAELYLSYTLIRALQLLLDDIDRRLNQVGYELKGEQKNWYKNFRRQFVGAIMSLSKFDDDIANAYEKDFKNFDYFNKTANDLLRVSLRLVIANEGDPEVLEKIDRELKMKFSLGIPEKDIERFTMK